MLLLLMQNLNFAWGEQEAPEGGGGLGRTLAAPKVMGAMKARG